MNWFVKKDEQSFTTRAIAMEIGSSTKLEYLKIRQIRQFLNT